MTSDPQTYPKIYGERGDSNTVRLTDAERRAIEETSWVFGAAKAHPEWQAMAATLRGLLERTK